MNLIFAGSGEFGLPSLAALLTSEHRVVQLVTQPDRPAGRGRQLKPTPIGQLAIDRGLPLLRTEDINREVLPAADLLVVIAFGQKISPSTIEPFPKQAINLHASLLPKYRGAGPVNAAILAGDAVSGNSIIRLAERMDAGAVLGQSSLAIGELETAGELHDRLADDGAPLLLRVIAQLAKDSATELPQDETQVSKASKLSRASTRIDWSASAVQIACQIRGLYPWPGCQVELLDVDLRVITTATLAKAVALADVSGEPGVVRADGTIGTGTGVLRIVELQPQGKRLMPLAAFRNGYRWEAGMRLRSANVQPPR